MLSRAFHDRKKAASTKGPMGEEGSTGSTSRSRSFQPEEEEEAFGHMNDLPLTFCSTTSFRAVGLREILQSSVEVLGESGLGISEKVVLWDGMFFVAKRFRRVLVRKGEFGRRVERLALVSARCESLVPLRAYLYAKRTKLVLFQYHPMGSLAVLLSGERRLGHTPLDWNIRLKIIFHVANAIMFIHSISPAKVNQLQMNVHGNIKASNVFIRTDFSACLSDYGFFQLAERPEPPGTQTHKKPEITDLAEELSPKCGTPTQSCDMLSFGTMVLDILGGPTAPFQISIIRGRLNDIKEGRVSFFEFHVEGRDKMQALLVLEIALACTNRSPEARPPINQVLENLRRVRLSIE
ncbi:hypothetical protein AAC387_Pa12g1824 [Persea americana]